MVVYKIVTLLKKVMKNLIDCNYEADMFLMLFEFQSTYDPQSYEIFIRSTRKKLVGDTYKSG
jgi:hypothetical protein